MEPFTKQERGCGVVGFFGIGAALAAGIWRAYESLPWWVVAVMVALCCSAAITAAGLAMDRRDPREPESSPPQSRPAGPDPVRMARAEAMKILGLQESFSPAELRAAYRSKVMAYHPDRVREMAPEIQALAEQRTKELNDAHRLLEG